MKSKTINQDMRLGSRQLTDLLNGVFGGAFKDILVKLEPWLKTNIDGNATHIVCNHAWANPSPNGNKIIATLTLLNQLEPENKSDAIAVYREKQLRSVTIAISGLGGGPFTMAAELDKLGRHVKTLHLTPSNNVGAIHFDEARMALSSILSGVDLLTTKVVFKCVDDGVNAPEITVAKTVL